MKTNCDNCGAGLTLDRYQDSLSCRYCETMHLPSLREAGIISKLEGPASPLACPVCRASLGHARIDQWHFHFCPGCHGLLLEGDDLLNIVRYVRQRYDGPPREPEPVDPRDLEREIGCPACAQPMHAHPYYGPGHFVIDWCRGCRRLWLDGGELHRATIAEWGESLWR